MLRIQQKLGPGRVGRTGGTYLKLDGNDMERSRREEATERVRPLRRQVAVSRVLMEGLASDSRGEIPQLQLKGSGFGEEVEHVHVITVVQLFQ